VQAGKALNFTVSASDPDGAPAVIAVSGLPASAKFDPNHGAFSWVPSTSQVGAYSVHFTATDAAQATSSADVIIDVESTTPVALRLVNAASYADDGGCSAGSLVTLLGGSFTHSQGQPASVSPLPTTLNGARVKGNGVNLPVMYASEFQVTLQCPQLAPGTTLSLVAESSNGSSAPLASTTQYATPGIFSIDGSGKGQGAVVLANTGIVAMQHVDGLLSQPVNAGDFVSIYATGLGPVSQIIPNGQPAPLTPSIPSKPLVDVLINGVATNVQFAGLAPGYIGLYQVNAQIPTATAANSATSVQLVVHLPNGSTVLSNVVTIAVAAAH
jgi:uncharacterized protein (TIGR03437 family)